MTCPFVEVTGGQGLKVSVSDEWEWGKFGIDNVDISAATLLNCRVQEGAVCVQCEHGYDNHPETSSCEPHDHGASGDVYHQTFDADASGTGVACSDWGGHAFSCGALGGVCTNDHDHHWHDDQHDETTRGALSKTFAVPAGHYNVTLDFIQIDDEWDTNVAHVEVNGVVCWTQDFKVYEESWNGMPATPGGLAQCKLDFEKLYGQEHCPQGNCEWYVARLSERESL